MEVTDDASTKMQRDLAAGYQAIIDAGLGHTIGVRSLTDEEMARVHRVMRRNARRPRWQRALLMRLGDRRFYLRRRWDALNVGGQVFVFALPLFVGVFACLLALGQGIGMIGAVAVGGLAFVMWLAYWALRASRP